ncbi:MAG TPA: hypothetical protein VD768_08880 [Sphingomicrobium sp.]|nr:hypothetical protein [Sphingomicrobium sp.]
MADAIARIVEETVRVTIEGSGLLTPLVERAEAAAGAAETEAAASAVSAAEAAAAAADAEQALFRHLERSTINLYHTDNYTPDARLEADGSELFESGGMITDFLPVSPSTTYSIGKFADDGSGVAGGSAAQGIRAAGNTRIHTYTSADALVQAITTPASTFTTGLTETKVRLSGIIASERNRYMLVEGTDLPSVFTPYHQYALRPVYEGSATVITPEPRKFEGQRIAVLGDSLSVDEDSWWSHILEPLGFVNSPFLDNIAPFGGSVQEDRLAVTGSSYARHVGYGTESGLNVDLLYLHRRIAFIPPDRDVIFVGTGTNERSTFQNPGGTSEAIEVGDLDEQWALYLADPDTVDDTTTFGAVIVTLHKLIEAFPTKKIYGIGPPHRANSFDTSAVQLGGLSMLEHSQNIESVYNRFGIPFFRSCEVTALRPWNATNLAANYDDDTHLSAAGHRIWGEAILAWLKAQG